MLWSIDCSNENRLFATLRKEAPTSIGGGGCHFKQWLIRIDKWFPSSQTCSVCGYKNPETKDLGMREWDCPNCKSHHDRDLNAAINIRAEGMRIISISL